MTTAGISVTRLQRARLIFHAKQIAKMFATVPAFLFMLYLGIGVVDVLDSTLARMHLPGGTSAGASTIASPLSLASRGAASDAIDQWNQWSDRYTEKTFGAGAGTGLPVGVVLLLYVVIDVLLIALPVFLIIWRMNGRATGRLKDFLKSKNAEATDTDPSVQQTAVDALSRVSGLDGLLRMSWYSAIAFFVLAVLENAFLLWAGTSQRGLLLMVTGGLSIAKWLALASALIGLVVGLIGSRAMRRDPKVGIQHNVQRAGNRWSYLLALRVQIGVSVFLLLFGALGGDLGHQLDDAFLFPFGRGGDIARWTGVVASILFVTSLVTANLCLRVYLPRTTRTTSDSAVENVYMAVEPKHATRSKIRSSIISGSLLVGLAVAAHFLRWPIGIFFLAPGILLILVGLYSIPASPKTKPDVFNTSTYGNNKIGWRYSVGAAVVPLVVLTALAVRNGARLLTIHEYGYGWLLLAGFPFGAIGVGLILGGLTYWILHRCLGRIDDQLRERNGAVRRDGRPARWSALAVGILAVALLIVMASSPQQSGGLLGPWGVVFALCIFLALAGTALVMLSDQIRAWGVVAATGFRRTPFFVAILICFMVNSAIDDGYVYHDVRLGSDLSDRKYVGLLGSSPRPDFQIDLKTALDQWSELQRTKNPERKEVPLVFIASAGGGIRAAYWTALVMQCLVSGDGNACPNPVLPMDSIFLASGISGGSLGLAGIHGVPSKDWLETLQHDFLGPTVAAMAFRDLPNAFLRLNIHDSDRATVLERAWENAAGGEGAGLDRGLVQTARNSDGSIAFPLLLLNGTSVTDGCRVAVTALDLSTITPPDGHTPSSATDCLALNQQRFAENDPVLPKLPATKDVFDISCSGNSVVPHDIRLSTAALLSARFPYVSPTGALHSCNGGGRTFDLDGGLIDSSGALPVAMIWPEIVRWLNNQDDTVCFAPKLIIMENGYLEQTKSSPPAHPSELAAPLSATMATQAAAAPTARQAAALTFQKSFAKTSCGPSTHSGAFGWNVPNVVDFYPVAQPGIQAPLGWTLSRYSQESLKSEMDSDRIGCAADIVAAWFSGSMTETEACRRAGPE